MRLWDSSTTFLDIEGMAGEGATTMLQKRTFPSIVTTDQVMIIAMTMPAMAKTEQGVTGLNDYTGTR